jgi:FdhE protein
VTGGGPGGSPSTFLTPGGELGEVPYLRPHPGAATAFGRRAARFTALAPAHAAGDYLALLSRLAAAQREVVGRVHLPGRSAPVAGSLPIDSAGTPPEAWREALRLLLLELAAVPMPAPARAALERLGRLSSSDLDRVASRLLAGRAAPLDLPLAPFVGAALQVVYTALAAGLPAAAVARVEEGCPVCGASPTCGLVLGDDKLRYLVCGLCATTWHHTRVQCVLCRSAETVAYLSLEGDAGPARAETCDGCQAYLKLLYLERGPALEPLVDDLATMALDVLVGERGYRRLGQNPYLVVGEGAAEA